MSMGAIARKLRREAEAAAQVITTENTKEKKQRKSKFIIGDVVRFKTGGNPMTVLSVKGNDVELVWFEEDEKKEGWSPASQLVKE